MLVAADTHVHIYPNHDLRVFLDSAFRNLAGLAPPDKDRDLARVLCLTEGAGSRAFRELREGRLALPEGYVMEPADEEDAVRIRHGEDDLILVAGRQIVTAERLEVLALATGAEVPDGQPVAETLEAVRAVGGVPVLAWAPGKWFGARGRVVREAIDSAEPAELLLGDSSMRPTCWPEPRLVRRGRERGLRVIAGSDPLPPAGEEAYPGSYGICADVPFDVERPVTGLRDMLKSGPSLTLCGRRCGPLEMAGRWNRHRKNKGS